MRSLLSLLLFLLLSFAAQAQKQLLETRVSLHCVNEPLEAVLSSLQQHYGLEFSYSDDVIPVNAAVSISVAEQPLRLLLDQLAEEYFISYRVLKNRIILSRSSALLTQTIRGQVIDQQTGAPVAGAMVRIAGTGSSSPIGSISNGEGHFTISGVAVGRAELLISCVGYHTRSLPGLLISSSKELVLDIKLVEAVAQLEEVVITASQEVGQGQHALPLVSARSFTVEESWRFAGSLGDPARMAANFAGVTGASDESNALVIRGNSPRGVLWQIEGIEVPNPNHFSTEGASSGVVSVLSANVLEGANFLTGAFSAEYGNALSGVFDLRLRRGNNQKREHSFQAGILGLEASTEGPFAAGHTSSYLINYRYSTLSVLDKLGFDLNRAGEFKNYQDLTFKIHLPTDRSGTFSFFGIGGLSRSNLADTTVLDSNYSDVGVLGLTHLKTMGGGVSIRSLLSLSGTHISRHDKLLSWSDRILQLDEDYSKSYARAAVSALKRFSASQLAEGGLVYSRLFYQFFLRERDSENAAYNEIINFKETGSASIVQAYIRAHTYITPGIRADYGLHLLHFGLTDDSSLEPRLSLRYQLSGNQVISAGFGKHSKIENLQYYLGRDHQIGGRELQLNADLGFTRALHYVLGYEQSLSASTLLKLETYFQQLYQVPVQLNPASLYAAINEESGFITDTLINNGNGRNYGVELSLEKNFSRNFYYLLNGSLYNSTFQMADGREWNTTYNGNYSLQALAGLELPLRNREAESLLGINFKLSWAGGRRYIPLDEEASIQQDRQVLDFQNAFEPKLPHYFRADIQLHYRRHRPGLTSEWRLDIQNTTNHRNAAYYFYNTESNRVQLKRQIGLLPIMSYRIEF
jgi:hypothetical protein